MILSTDERNELRATARTLLGRTSGSGQVRTVVDTEPGFDRALWDQMVLLGWTSIHVGAEHGGAGCSYTDLAVVLHELGRAITPSPFLASAVLATGALMRADNPTAADRPLGAIAAGEAVGTVAFANTDGSYDTSRLTVTLRPDGAGFRLDGVAGFVLDADVADHLIVAAIGPTGTTAIVVAAGSDGIQVQRSPTIDATRRLFIVSFDGVAVDAGQQLCAPGRASQRLLSEVLSLGVISAAIDATGATERALEETARYATERMQFGKPIGSFQAVKHHCANMALSVEASRAATGAAAEALDGDPSRWAFNAAITSSYVGPACSDACALSMRVYGGVGFTWAQDTHLYLKRVKLDEMLFGTPSWHRRRLADEVFPGLIA